MSCDTAHMLKVTSSIRDCMCVNCIIRTHRRTCSKLHYQIGMGILARTRDFMGDSEHRKYEQKDTRSLVEWCFLETLVF